MAEQAPDWKEAATVVITLLGGAEIGIAEMITTLLGAFWPEEDNTQSIWESLQGQVQELVDDSILADNLATCMAQLKTLRTEMHAYATSPNPGERPSQLTVLVHSCNELADQLLRLYVGSNADQLLGPAARRAPSVFLGSAAGKVPVRASDPGKVLPIPGDSAHKVTTLPYFAAFALCHLAVLRERAVYGVEVYGPPGNPAWLDELNSAVVMYQRIAGGLQPLVEWRAQQIESSGEDGSVVDKLTNQALQFTQVPGAPWGTSPDWRPTVGNAVLSIQKRWLSEILNVVEPMFHANRFVPGHEKDAPVVPADAEDLTVGPISNYVMSNSARCNWQSGAPHAMVHNPYVASIPDERYTEITGLVVSVADQVTGVQVLRDTGRGRLVGELTTLTTPIQVPPGRSVTAVATHWDLNLTGICLHYSDGTRSPAAGSAPTRPASQHANSDVLSHVYMVPQGYTLIDVQVQELKRRQYPPAPPRVLQLRYRVRHNSLLKG